MGGTLPQGQQPTRGSLALGALAITMLFATGAFVGTSNVVKVGVGAGSATSLASTKHGALWNPKMSPVFDNEPLGKSIVRHFDYYLLNGATFDNGEQKLRNVEQWLAPEFQYHTVGFPNSSSAREWCLGGEETGYRTAFPTTSFSQMLFFGSDKYATTTSYGNALWNATLFGIPAPKKFIYFRVLDFYTVRSTGPGEGLLNWNFMAIDWADLFARSGRPVLPPATLPEGFVMTAHANDGVPAPLSVVAAGRDSVIAKAAAAGALADGWAGDSLDAKWWHRDLTFYGPGGIGLAQGAEQFQQHVLGPYRAAFADRRCETQILFCEGNYCGGYGIMHGRHVGTWVGQAATNRTVAFRFGMHWRVVGDKIQEGWAIFDMPGFLAQIGKDFFAIARNQ